MSTAALFITAKKQKQPTCPSTSERVIKMWYIYTEEYYSAIKSDEVLTHTIAWRLLRNITLGEKAKHKRLHIVRFNLYAMSRTGKSIETESKSVAV